MDPSNLLPLCRAHHDEQHRRGWVFMAQTYIAVLYWLCATGNEEILELADARAEGRPPEPHGVRRQGGCG